MSFCQDFINGILPGNYALTKSMELTKAGSCGTLWYVKKFLVLYYYIFLTDKIFYEQYKNEIVDIFNNYIEDLDESVKTEAYKFFYTDNETTNFTSPKFKTYLMFAPETNFKNENERNNYHHIAKKYYFHFLMGVGGQSGIKKILKEIIQSESFSYTQNNLKEAIYSAGIISAYSDMINYGTLRDNSLKYVFSEKAINEIKKHPNIQKNEIKEIMEKYPITAISNQMINDTHAFLRNERQVLYYYGFFHSKSSGANDIEFSSLTPIGQLALKANSKEFLAIWEHQKIKMISQPVTVDINNLPTTVNGDNFSIGFTPYLDILEFLKRNDKLSLKEYKYILSRKNHLIEKSAWNENEKKLINNIDVIEDKINSWKRSRDIKDEDSRKELLKYLLGIRSDLRHDNSKNLLNIVAFDNEVVITNKNELELLCNIYSKLNKYKIKRYQDLFLNCENDLKKNYKYSIQGINPHIDERIKIQWDFFNIRNDTYILLGTIFTHAIIVNNLIDKYFATGNNFNEEDLEKISEYMDDNYKYILYTIGLKNKSKIKKFLINLIKSFNTDNYEYFIEDNFTSKENIKATYRSTSNLDLLTKLKEKSKEIAVDEDGKRIRKTTLINMLKSYYMNNYLNNKTLHCECCGHDTFITENGDPYLEFHHLIPFSIAFGPDHYLNLYGLCPNCHRKIHFLSIPDKIPEYQNININNFFQKTIVDRLLEIKKDKMLASYHLEYLLAENAITEEEYNKIAG